jgi:Fe2+ transport system protein B
MLPRSFLVSVFFLVFCSGAVSPVFADAKAEQAAVAVAGAWLNLVDQGRYGDSWQQAASLFQTAVNKEQWAASLQTIRQSLGKVISRKLNKKQYTHSLPGAPDGEYVVLEFYTVFEKKKNAVETVTPMLDSDGQWKVSGYYIR